METNISMADFYEKYQNENLELSMSVKYMNSKQDMHQVPKIFR